MPLQLTAKERRTLAAILALFVLGLIGMAVLRDDPAAPAAAPATNARKPPPRS